MPAEEKSFVADDGVTVYYRVWKPTAAHRATAMWFHGFGEHSGRYEHVFSRFQDAGIAVVAPDHRGHGQTFELNKAKGALRGYVQVDAMFSSYVKLINEIEKELRGDKPVIVFGHSMGGLFSLYFSQQHHGAVENFAGVGAGAPLMGFTVSWLQQKLLLGVGSLFPTFTITAPLDKNALCNDPVVVEEYLADPLVHDKLATGTARYWNTAIESLKQGAPNFRLPLLITAQPNDKVVPFAPIKDFFDRAASEEKNMVAMGPEFEHEGAAGIITASTKLTRLIPPKQHTATRAKTKSFRNGRSLF